MPSVGHLCIPAIQLAHAEREIRLRGFKEEMIVVVHQTIGMAEPAVPIDDVREYREELRAVAVVHHDGLPGVPTARDVVHGPRKLNAQRTSHGAGVYLLLCMIARPDPIFWAPWLICSHGSTPGRLSSGKPCGQKSRHWLDYRLGCNCVTREQGVMKFIVRGSKSRLTVA